MSKAHKDVPFHIEQPQVFNVLTLRALKECVDSLTIEN